LQKGQRGLVLVPSDGLLVSDQCRKAQHADFEISSKAEFVGLPSQLVVAAARPDHPQQVERPPAGHQELMARRGQARTVRLPLGRSGCSKAGLKSLESLQESIDIAALPAVDQIQIEGGDRHALQNCGDAAHDDELHSMPDECSENGEEIGLRFCHRAASRWS